MTRDTAATMQAFGFSRVDIRDEIERERRADDVKSEREVRLAMDELRLIQARLWRERA